METPRGALQKQAACPALPPNERDPSYRGFHQRKGPPKLGNPCMESTKDCATDHNKEQGTWFRVPGPIVPFK